MNHKGVDLIGTKERAMLCDNSLEIESVLGRGSTVFVRVPLSGLKKGK